MPVPELIFIFEPLPSIARFLRTHDHPSAAGLPRGSAHHTASISMVRSRRTLFTLGLYEYTS